MSKVIGDVMFPNGKYLKDGEEKTRWLKCGVLLETDKGMRLKLECIPLGIEPGSGWFSIFEKKDDHPKTQSVKTEKPNTQDEIPF